MKAKIVLQVFLAAGLIALFALSCRRVQKAPDMNQHEMVRLIDHLGPSQVINTPFTGLKEKFERVEENFSNFTLLNELSTSKQKVWGITTGRSIMGQDDFIAPQGMDALFDNKSLSFLEESNGSTVQWKWIETNRKIDIRSDDNFNRAFQCVILDEGVSFDFEMIFPNAPVQIEIYARRNWHPLDMEVLIDETVIQKAPVGRDFSWFQCPAETTLGTHKISLRSSLNERIPSQRQTPPRLLIYEVRIRSQKDVVLFFVPSENQKEFDSGQIALRYLSDYDESGHLNLLTFLYKIKNDFALDQYDQAENPDNIKKKIVVENLSLDAIMAPPYSHFEFEIKISENCFLEFGTGIFCYEENRNNQAARFKVMAETDRLQEVLYEKEMALVSGSLRDQMTYNKISLSSFSGKKVKLTFQTENSQKEEKASTEEPAFSFWVNPVVFRPSSTKPNVILVSLDTLRADHMGCYGYERLTSPALDQLTEDAVLFEQTYAQSPWTLPSHLSMLFSLNTASHQVYYNNQKMDASLPSLATFLRDNGFSTYAFTGGGYISSVYGFSKGFDWYAEPVGGQRASLRFSEAEQLCAVASDWLQKVKDRPFFLFLHTFQIHGPYNCPSPWNELFLEEDSPWKKMALRNFLDKNGAHYPFSQKEIENIVALYDAEIRYTDDKLIKPLIQTLKQLGIYDNTLLIITSDHGEEFNDHGGWLHGQTVYDELIRVPLIIKFPNSKHQGLRISAKNRLIDIMPTVLEAVGVKYNKKSIEGRSLIPLLSGEEKKDRIYISDLAHKNIPDPCPALMATNRDTFKFIIRKSKTGIQDIEIYDLGKDPYELSNIFPGIPKLREEVIQSLQNYYEQKKKIKRKKLNIQIDKDLEEKLRALGYLH